MTLEQLEQQVADLPAEELKAFSRWFDEFMAEAWDAQIERDSANGKFDALLTKLDADFASGSDSSTAWTIW